MKNYLLASDKDNIDAIMTSNDLRVLQRSQIDGIIYQLAGLTKPIDSLDELSVDDLTIHNDIMTIWSNQQ